jgi:hypothetical protein
MTSFLSRIFRGHVSHENVNIKTPASKNQSNPFEEANKKITQVANKAINEFAKITAESESFLQSIKDFATRCQRKNERNVLIYFLGCDFSKIKVKASDIKIAVNYCIKRVEAGNVSQSEKQQIAAFFNKISSLEEDQFDRHALLKNQRALQRLLSPELDKLWSLEEKNPSLKTNTQHQLAIAVAKAMLSSDLGFGISSTNKGANGAKVVRDLENHPVGVFKAPPVVKWYQLAEQLKKFFGQARLLCQNEMAQQFAEVAAFEFDKIMMGSELAPAATMIKLQNKEGAFLAFLGGYKELKDCETKLEARDHFDKKELILWQKKCIHNKILGNADGHNENDFMKLDENNKIVDIRVIDHGNCFLEHNPGNWGSKGNLGAWGKYKISSKNFEPEALEFIRDQLTDSNLEKFVQRVATMYTGFWTHRMDQLTRQRLQLVRDGILSGKITNCKQLAELQTNEHYNKFFENNKKIFNENATLDGSFVVLDIN